PMDWCQLTTIRFHIRRVVTRRMCRIKLAAASQLVDYPRFGRVLSRHYAWSVILHGKQKDPPPVRPCPRSLLSEALQPPDGTVIYPLDTPIHPVPFKATPRVDGRGGGRVLPDRPRGYRKRGRLHAEPVVGGD